MKKTLIILLGFIAISCKQVNIQNGKEVRLTEIPLYIETSDYALIKESFNLHEVQRADLLLGSLTPKYPLAYGVFFSRSEEVLFRQGCLSPYGYCIVLKDTLGFHLIKNKADLKKYYAPIETKEEAISYAYAFSGLKPRYDFDIKPEFRTFTKTFKTTNAIESDEGYEVNLFDYIMCGCGPHTHLMISFMVKKTGDIYLKETQKLYEDPNEDGLCVD